jgi:glycosyltransferase involved in cell wall biosynthesis
MDDRSDQPGNCLLTIVIPTYNGAAFLSRATESALIQLDARGELIVVDDGSTDGSAEMLSALAERHPRTVRVLTQPNAGPASARANGARQARGRYLLFLDVDDELCEGAVPALLSFLASEPRAGIVAGARQARLADGRLRDTPPPTFTASRRDNLLRFVTGRASLPNGSFAVRRDLLERVPVDRGLGHTEDIPFVAQLLANADVTTLHQPLVRVHKRADSRRHDADRALALGMDLVDAVFDPALLDAECMALRPLYQKRRIVSLMKLCHRTRRFDDASRYYRQLLRTHPLTALSPRNLRRGLAALVRRTAARHG